MTAKPDVRPGQVWADNDRRSYGRRVRVVAIEPAQPATPHTRAVPARAVVEQVSARTHDDAQPGRRTRIRLDRFRPTSTGYRLVQDADTTPARPHHDEPALDRPVTTVHLPAADIA